MNIFDPKLFYYHTILGYKFDTTKDIIGIIENVFNDGYILTREELQNKDKNSFAFLEYHSNLQGEDAISISCEPNNIEWEKHNIGYVEDENAYNYILNNFSPTFVLDKDIINILKFKVGENTARMKYELQVQESISTEFINSLGLFNRLDWLIDTTSNILDKTEDIYTIICGYCDFKEALIKDVSNYEIINQYYRLYGEIMKLNLQIPISNVVTGEAFTSEDKQFKRLKELKYKFKHSDNSEFKFY